MVVAKVSETGASGGVLAPPPDFRYLGLEPVTSRIGALAAALGFGREGAATRIALVPWGVLVEEPNAPRILRWPGVRKVEVLFASPRGSRVVVATDRDRFVGAGAGTVKLDRLIDHLEAWAAEQSRPLALGLDADAEGPSVAPHEPAFEALASAVRSWLSSAAATRALALPDLDYRRAGAGRQASSRAVELLRAVLRDRGAHAHDARAYAAFAAAELGATALGPDLVVLSQSPHPFVAALAKQAARKLGVARARTGTLEEVAPFLLDPDRAQLDAWARS